MELDQIHGLLGEVSAVFHAFTAQVDSGSPCIDKGQRLVPVLGQLRSVELAPQSADDVQSVRVTVGEQDVPASLSRHDNRVLIELEETALLTSDQTVNIFAELNDWFNRFQAEEMCMDIAMRARKQFSLILEHQIPQ